MSALRIAVIGCGQWGPNHVRNFGTIAGCEVRWVADMSEARLGAMKQQFPGVGATRDALAAIQSAEVDAVVVATPTSTHHALCRAALEAGKHVLCEKPLTLRASESVELVKLAEKSGLVLMVGHVFMFNPGILYLREQMEKGSLGKVYYMDAVRTNLGPIRRDVGAMYDLASHDISVFGFLLGKEPVEVSARGGFHLEGSHEDVAFLTLEYPGGQMCHAHVSWLNPRKVRQLTVVGEKRMAVWDDMSPLEPIRLYDKGLQETPYYDSFGQFQMILRDGDVTIPKVKMFEPLRRQSEEFVDCVRTGRKPAADGRNGLAVVRVLEAATRSIKSHGRSVNLEEVEGM